MLIQSALPGSYETSLSLSYENGTCDWTIMAENCKECSTCVKSSVYPGEKQVLLVDGESNQGKLHLSKSVVSCSQRSSVCTVEKYVPTLVYQRKKAKTKFLSLSSTQTLGRKSDGCLSNISSEKLSMNMISESKSKTDRFGIETEFCCLNESYSSSKSNGELGSTSLRIDGDDTCECSSSSALVVEEPHDLLSERDACISLIRNQWFSKGIWPFKFQSSNEKSSTTNNNIRLRKCKVCEIDERSSEMLICDDCEEAFHLSCCNPRVKKIPVEEWFCYSCLKNKYRILSDINTKNKRNNCSEVGSSEEAMCLEELGPIALMLIGVGPYTPGVRIGREFQADVPEWSGPSLADLDAINEPVVLNITDYICLHGKNGNSKLSRISSIGNWVQCRQVVEGIGDDIDGTICGKWRRAPLFEVQTDNWECFRCILWDPAHADCAAPQELDTEEILKQLKYIEMLRPRLIIKRRKLDQVKDAGQRENSQIMVKNIRTT